MKTAFKIVLWCLLVVTLGLAAFAVVANNMAANAPEAEVAEMQKLFDLALDLNFFWGYALFAIVIVSAIIAFFINVITHPSGMVKVALGLVLAAAVVALPVVWVCYFREILPVPNSAGGVFDNVKELRISEIGLFVTYIVAGLAILAVIVDMLSGLVRRIVK